MLNWDKLLCEERIRKSHTFKDEYVTRNEFHIGVRPHEIPIKKIKQN